MNKITLNCELTLYANNTTHLFDPDITNNIVNCAKNILKEIETKVKVPKIPKIHYNDLPQSLREQIQKEIDIINDNQEPENLYNNIISSSGTVGSIANIFDLPFGLVMKLRELNKLI
jgi:endonuclease IV